MASREQRENLARAGMEAFNEGDVDRMLGELAASDIEVYASPEMANAGSFHGHDGFVRWIVAWTDAWEELSTEVTETVFIGDRHVATAIHQGGAGGPGSSSPWVSHFSSMSGRTASVTSSRWSPRLEEAVRLAEEREAP